MSERRRQEIDRFARALVRLNAHVLGATLAVLAAVGLFVATLALLLQGGDVTGPLLGQLAYLMPGYSVSVGGACIGALWAALFGYAAGVVFSRAYGPWLLREATLSAGGSELPDEPGSHIARLSPAPMSLATGALLALALFTVTNWLSLSQGYHSPNLALLSHYLPGYATSFPGSVVGAFWAFVYGYAGAGITAEIYNAVVTLRTRRG